MTIPPSAPHLSTDLLPLFRKKMMRKRTMTQKMWRRRRWVGRGQGWRALWDPGVTPLALLGGDNSFTMESIPVAHRMA